MYSIPAFSKLHQVIVQEIRNKTGLSITPDSDASIRADGTAAVVEGLYHHQAYIQHQLFVQTADEPYLYIHAEELNVPRLGGTRAAGTVKAKSNAEITIEAETKLTDKGHFWSIIYNSRSPNITTEISVTAGSDWCVMELYWQFSIWVSPIAGLNGTAEVVSIAGGSDEEELEAWRARMLASKQLGQARDRGSDL